MLASAHLVQLIKQLSLVRVSMHEARASARLLLLDAMGGERFTRGFDEEVLEMHQLYETHRLSFDYSTAIAHFEAFVKLSLKEAVPGSDKNRAGIAIRTKLETLLGDGYPQIFDRQTISNLDVAFQNRHLIVHNAGVIDNAGKSKLENAGMPPLSEGDIFMPSILYVRDLLEMLKSLAKSIDAVTGAQGKVRTETFDEDIWMQSVFNLEARLIHSRMEEAQNLMAEQG